MCCNYFFIEAVPNTANASPSGVQGTTFFYAISFQSVNSKACGSKVLRRLFIFFVAES